MATIVPNAFSTQPGSPGFKADKGKNRLGLIFKDFSRSLELIGEIATFGAEKYTDHGWLHVPDAEKRYRDALYRHLLAFERGEELDPETGLNHLGHAAWNVMAILDLKLRKEEKPQ